jgi:sortase A
MTGYFDKKNLAINFFFLILIVFIAYLVFNKNTVEITARVTVPVLSQDYSGEEATSTPISISIPSIDVAADVVKVGITSEGNMAVPSNFDDTGWYRRGPAPGQVGNAVVAGHLDDGRGNGAVFERLSELRIGDKVFVTNEVGEKLAFEVREIRLVSYNDPPLEEIFGTSTAMRLNLITCDGTWLPEKNMYDKRLVVFTDRVAIE